MAAAVSSSLPSVEQSLYVVRVDDVGSVLESDEESVHELLQGGGSLPVESRSSKLFVLIVIRNLDVVGNCPQDMSTPGAGLAVVVNNRCEQ